METHQKLICRISMSLVRDYGVDHAVDIVREEMREYPKFSRFELFRATGQPGYEIRKSLRVGNRFYRRILEDLIDEHTNMGYTIELWLK